MKKKHSRALKLIYKGSIDEIDHALIYKNSFGLLSPVQRLEEGWKMVQHAWELKGRNLDELRLNRTVAVIKRP
jgi:hypothetical protein